MLGSLSLASSAAPSLPPLAASHPFPIPSSFPLPPLLAAAGDVLSPVVILVLCLVAGVGTVLLLPSGREAPLRKVGGAIVLAAAMILVALLVQYGARRGGPGVYFWAFAAIALVGAVRVVTHPRPVYSALYFVLTVFATSGLFILLWAEFMAAALILIYAGAILVTYVFVIMLASSSAAPAPARGHSGSADSDGPDGGRAGGASALAPMAEYDAVSREPLVASAVGFALMGVLLFVIFDRSAGLMAPLSRDGAGKPVEDALMHNTPGSTQKLGVYLFQNHAVNLELAGLLLTVSMVGAIVIARRRVVMPEAVVGGRPSPPGRADVFHAPMTPVDDNPHSIPVYGTENPRHKQYPET